MPKVQITLEVADQQAVGALKNFSRATADAIGQVKASDPALRSATVRVNELTTAKAGATTAAQQWRGALVLLPAELQATATQVSGLASALRGPAGLAAGFIGAAGAGLIFARQLSDDIERLDNLSRQTGLSVAALQAFEHAARQAGEAPETLVHGLGKVNAAIQDVISGAPNAGKAFEAIGVPLRRMVQEGASAEDILQATAQALVAIPDPTARAAAQMELFGVRVRAMSTVLDTIAQKSLPGYVGELRAAGIVTTEETNRMAREFDAFVDRAQAKLKAFTVQTGADVLSAIENIRKMWNLTLEIFKDPAAAGLAVQGGQAHEIVRPGVLTAGAGRQERTIAASTADLAAQQKAIEEAAKAWGEYADAIFETDEVLLKFDADARKVRQDAAQAERDLAMAQEFRELEKALQDGRQALDDFQPSLEQGLDAMRETNRAVDASVGFFQAWGEEIGELGPVLQNVEGELEVLPPSIMAVRTEADLTFIRMRDVVEGASGSVERLAGQIRTELPSALEQFGAGFERVSAQLVQHFTDWTQIGAQTAMDLHTAFSDSFFSVMKGDLDSLGDVWKGFLDAVLRHIADFLAASAVTELIDLPNKIRRGVEGGGFDIFGFNIPSFSFGGGGGGGGGGSLDFPLPDFPSAGGLTLTQQRRDFAARPVQVEIVSVRPDAARGATDGPVGGGPGTGGGLNFGGITDILGSIGRVGFGFLGGGPFGAAIQIGKELLGAAQRFAAESAREVQDAMDLSNRATHEFNTASRRSAEEFDRMTTTTRDLTATQQDLTAAQQGLTAAQTDLAISTTDLVGVTATTTEVTNEFGFGVAELGNSIAAATEAAGNAAEIAGNAAKDAAQSAEAARDAAGAGGAESGGTGPSGTGGGGPGGPSGPFAAGGFVTRPTRALIGEAGPEAVVGLPSQQRFAREFAAAIAGQLGGAQQVTLLQEQNLLLRKQNRLLEQLGRGGGGRRAGAVV